MIANAQPSALNLLSSGFVRWWLPEGEQSGDAMQDLQRALARSYEVPGKAPRRLVKGLILATPHGATVNIEAPPATPLPDGVTWLKPSDGYLDVGALILDPPNAAFVVLELGQSGCEPHRFEGSGRGMFVLNGSRGPVLKARRFITAGLLASGLSKAAVKKAHGLLVQRATTDDVAPLDAAIEKTKLAPALLDLIERTTDHEMQAFSRAFAARTAASKAAEAPPTKEIA